MTTCLFAIFLAFLLASFVCSKSEVQLKLTGTLNSISLRQPDGDKPIRNFLDDPRRSGPAPDTDRKEGSRRHVRNWGGLDFDNVKTGTELEKEWTVSDK